MTVNGMTLANLDRASSLNIDSYMIPQGIIIFFIAMLALVLLFGCVAVVSDAVRRGPDTEESTRAADRREFIKTGGRYVLAISGVGVTLLVLAEVVIHC